MPKLKIFVVDDERILRVSITDDLRDAGYEVFEFADANAAFALLREKEPDIVVTDIKMPGMDGTEFLMQIKKYNPEISVVIMTAFATIETAIQTMKNGAFDYITKPFRREELLFTIQKISELKELKTENRILKKRLNNEYNFENLIGSTSFIKELTDQISLVLENKTSVLITGETGTGKELLTNIIHYNSKRKSKPLIKVSCAILAKEIFESELFGHAKGAFTGAEKEKIGRLELANSGTLYLDDIDDMPLELQVKLLRVLEEGEIEKVGSTETQKIDIRIIASTKVDLKKLVQEGKFREDLYYRLNVFPVHIPSIRERPNDIKYLVDFFYKKFTEEENPNFDDETYKILRTYPFPGNVRELRNIVERMCLYAHGKKITPDLIPNELKTSANIPDIKRLGKTSLTQLLEEFEQSALNNAMEQFKGNKTKAAESLGLPLSTFRTKLDKFGIG